MKDDTNIYVINLSDKDHRFRLFQEISDHRIKRFEAIDTRSNPRKYEEFNLNLNPVGLVNEFYFSQMYGAVGCFLSHYSVWNDIMENDIKSALILEDDASQRDVINFLSEGYAMLSDEYDQYDLIQLNKRTDTDIGVYSKYFNGTESYYVTNLGAKKLLHFVEDSSEFQNQVFPLPLKKFEYNGDVYKQQDYQCFKNEEAPNWNLQNNIPAPVDKFIGYCATSSLSEDIKLKIKISNQIGLHQQKTPSDVINKGEVEHWLHTEEQTNEFISSDKFRWWNTGLGGVSN